MEKGEDIKQKVETRKKLDDMIKAAELIGYKKAVKTLKLENQDWEKQRIEAHKKGKSILQLFVEPDEALLLTNVTKFERIQWKKLLHRIKQRGDMRVL